MTSAIESSDTSDSRTPAAAGAPARAAAARRPDPASQWAHRYPLALVFLLGLLAYSDGFTGGFVFDDLQHVRDNARIRDLGALLSWSGYRGMRHRFVGYLTFAANYALGKLEVVDYHLVNVVIHLVAAALVYALVVLAFRTPRLRGSALAPWAQATAFLAAALFATHPLQTQAVTYIVQRFTSLATVFYLATVVLFLRWRLAGEEGQAGRAALYAAAVAAALLGMKTKEIAFTAPFAVILCELSFFEPRPWRRRLFLLPIAATALVVPLTVLSAAGRAAPASAVAQATRVQTGVSRADYLLTQADVVTRYLRLLVWPAGQNVDPDVPVAHRLLEPRVLVGLALLGAVAALAAFLLRRTAWSATAPLDPAARLAAFGVGWFFLGLAVESSVIPIVDVMNEHRVYLPSVGFFCAVAAGVALLAHRLLGRRAALALVLAAVALSAALGVATFRRNRVWADELTLWADAARKSPGKARPHLNLGTALSVAGRAEEGARELRRAVELDPESSYGRAQLGAALVALGSLADAEPELRAAVRLSPDDPEALFNLGVVLLRTGRAAEAKPVLQHFLAVAPASYAAARRLAERAAR